MSRSIDDHQRLGTVRETLEKAVLKVCPRWLADRRDDIVQSAMMRLMAIADRGEESKLESASYLWRAAYTATMNEIRALRRRREESMDVDLIDRGSEAETVDPERAAMGRQLGEATLDCLARMVEPRRLAVQLRLCGYGLTEAARALGWDRKRVDNLLYRGLADLRRCLEGKGFRP